MKYRRTTFHRRTARRHQCHRRRTVGVLAVGMLVTAFAFAAYTVDRGFVNVTKGQVQNGPGRFFQCRGALREKRRGGHGFVLPFQ